MFAVSMLLALVLTMLQASSVPHGRHLPRAVSVKKRFVTAATELTSLNPSGALVFTMLQAVCRNTSAVRSDASQLAL